MSEQKSDKNTPDTKLITVSEVELKKMVEDAALSLMETLMAKQPSLAGFDTNVLGKVIGDAVADGMKKNTRPKVSIGQYLQRGFSIFHPNGPGKVLLRECYQNGSLVDPAKTHDEEIELLNRITHSGRYIDRLVEVFIEQNGSDDVVHIRFNNKSDAISELKGHISIPMKGKKSFFQAMLEEIVAAQEQEDKEMEVQEDMKREQRRRYFETKATKEARARAGV